MRGREGNTGLPNRYSQRSNRESRSKANCKLILVSTTDDGSLIGVFSDPDNPSRIHKNFHAVYVLKRLFPGGEYGAGRGFQQFSSVHGRK